MCVCVCVCVFFLNQVIRYTLKQSRERSKTKLNHGFFTQSILQCHKSAQVLQTEENFDKKAAQARVKPIFEKFLQRTETENEKFPVLYNKTPVPISTVGHHLHDFSINMSSSMPTRLIRAGFLIHMIHEGYIILENRRTDKIYRKENKMVDVHDMLEHINETNITDNADLIVDLVNNGYLDRVYALKGIKHRIWQIPGSSHPRTVHGIAKILKEKSIDFSQYESIISALLEAEYIRELIEAGYLDESARRLTSDVKKVKPRVFRSEASKGSTLTTRELSTSDAAAAQTPPATSTAREVSPSTTARPRTPSPTPSTGRDVTSSATATGQTSSPTPRARPKVSAHTDATAKVQPQDGQNGTKIQKRYMRNPSPPPLKLSPLQSPTRKSKKKSVTSKKKVIDRSGKRPSTTSKKPVAAASSNTTKTRTKKSSKNESSKSTKKQATSGNVRRSTAGHGNSPGGSDDANDDDDDDKKSKKRKTNVDPAGSKPKRKKHRCITRFLLCK